MCSLFGCSEDNSRNLCTNIVCGGMKYRHRPWRSWPRMPRIPPGRLVKIQAPMPTPGVTISWGEASALMYLAVSQVVLRLSKIHEPPSYADLVFFILFFPKRIRRNGNEFLCQILFLKLSHSVAAIPSL